MPASALPDLNTLWLKWTDVCNNCLRQDDFDNAIGATYHLNAVFGDENRVEINTEKYLQLTRQHIMVKCKSCHVEISKDDSEIIQITNTYTIQTITGEKETKGWHCSQCKVFNHLRDTEFIQERFKNPRYLGVIPEPPEKKQGIVGFKNYGHEVKNWCRLAHDEISYSFGIERREYVPKNERDDMLDNADND